jgi:membrane associated rhomboid family serine protease
MKHRRPLPLATVGLVLTNLGAYALELALGGLPVCEAYGFVPERFLRSGGLAPVLASTFLHDPSSPAHIAGNMVFLAIFGTLAERALGRSRLLALYLLAGLGGAAMHLLVQPLAAAALVGASGAVAGLMAVGAVVRPRAMLGFTIVYIGMNLLGLFVTTPLIPADASVAAHVGGFSTGALAVMTGRLQGAVLV